MKLFNILFAQEYSEFSDEKLIKLNRSGKLSGIPYFALQKELSKRGLTTYRIIEIEKKAANNEELTFSDEKEFFFLRHWIHKKLDSGMNYKSDKPLNMRDVI